MQIVPTDYPFRAWPDGVTDCSRAIQDAIDSALQAGGGTVRLDVPGTYLCDNQIVTRMAS